MYVVPTGRGRPTTLVAADLEYKGLLEEETAKPKESSKEPTYRAYRALFSHFPRRTALGKASAT